MNSCCTSFNLSFFFLKKNCSNDDSRALVYKTDQTIENDVHSSVSGVFFKKTNSIQRTSTRFMENKTSMLIKYFPSHSCLLVGIIPTSNYFG